MVAAREVPLLRALPEILFDVALKSSCRVDAKARVCVRQSYYSVPARYAGRRLEVRLGADTVRILDAGTMIATHVRSLHKGSADLVLDHYLEGPGPQTRRAVRGPPPWWQPAAAAHSRRLTNGSGTPPASTSATVPGHVPWSGSCCTAHCQPQPWQRGWPPP